MLAVLPALVAALAYAVVVTDPRLDGHATRRRLAMVIASLGWGVFVVASTEILGAAHALTRGWVVATWAVPAGALAVVVVRRRSRSDGAVARLALDACDRTTRMWIGVCAVIIVLTAFIAVMAAPSSWDSLAYHLSRVERWIDQRSVAFYATSNPRQLYLGPGAEYALLHLHLLTGGDRFDNLVQWAAFAGSAVGVSSIAAHLGGDRRTQVFAALFAATVPMAIMQAATTQNDLVASYWLVCLATLVTGLSWARPRLVHATALAAAAGLATFTKATTYTFVVLFTAWLLARGRARPRLVAVVGLAAVGAVALNAPQLVRNYQAFGDPLGPKYSRTVVNDRFTPAALASNVIRHASAQLATPNVGANEVILRGVLATHDAMGMAVNEPDITYLHYPFGVSSEWNTEDSAGNPLHFVLMVCLLGFALTRRGLRPYAIVVIAGFALFVVTLRWQPWITRLEVPVFILAAPAVALAFEGFRARHIMPTAAVLLSVMSAFLLVGSRYRPLLANNPKLITGPSVVTTPRVTQRYIRQPELAPAYAAAADTVVRLKARSVGLLVPDDEFDYPLIVELDKAGGREAPEVHGFEVEGPAASLAKPRSFDAVVCVRCSMASSARLITAGYQTINPDPTAAVFARVR